MNSAQKINLQRLLNPRHAVFIGGRDAEFSAQLCAKAGYRGEIWGVNAKRSTMAGFPCFHSISELPQAPDAVFLAVPQHAAIDVVQELCDMGAGGIACFTAGFGELGEQGRNREEALIEAAGDMALVGPNCQGVLNYVHSAPLWPFGFPIAQFDTGAAIISQSGMLCSNLAMQQRSIPFSYMISAGNQAVLSVEDYLEVLIDDPVVTAIGLYIEALEDIERFSAVSTRALAEDKPIVALKGGSSEIGSQLTVTHTGSLAGSDTLYSALFSRLGIVQIDSTSVMLETLKLLAVAGAPNGKRIAAFTMSGGDAALVADAAEKIGLDTPQPSPCTARDLSALLPSIATVSNPLDLTTPLWGDEEQVPKVIANLLSDSFDAAVFVQDYPMADMDVSSEEYRADARSLIKATRAANIPAAVVSSLPENIDPATREWLIDNRVAPLQGINEAMLALAGGAHYSARRNALEELGKGFFRTTSRPMPGNTRVLNEWEGKSRLNHAGVLIPESCLVTNSDSPDVEQLTFPLVAKLVSTALPHKTEAGAVALNIADKNELTDALDSISQSVKTYDPNIECEHFLVEEMVGNVVAELLIGVRRDDHFGMMMVIASGGILVELLDDVQTLLLPAHRDDIANAIDQLKVSALIEGFRGKPGGNRANLIATIESIARFAMDQSHRVEELDINPLMVTPTQTIAADVLLRVGD